MIDITFHFMNKWEIKIDDTNDLNGDVVLVLSPLLEDSDDLAEVIPKINALFDQFVDDTKFTLLYCVVSRDFIIRNCNISNRLKSPA